MPKQKKINLQERFFIVKGITGKLFMLIWPGFCVFFAQSPVHDIIHKLGFKPDSYDISLTCPVRNRSL